MSDRVPARIVWKKLGNAGIPPASEPRSVGASAAEREGARMSPVPGGTLRALLGAAAVSSLLLAPAAFGAQSEAAATESVRGLLDRARSLAGLGETEAVVETLRRAIEAAPNSEEVLNAYARFTLLNGEPIQAILALEPLARMHPREAEYAYLLGIARMQVGEMADAVHALADSAALDPGRALTQVALGLALNQEKRFEEARAALATALRLGPDKVEALAAMSEAAEGLGLLDEAERLAGRALAIDPDHSTALVVVGMVRLKSGDVESAKEALERAVAADAESIKGHYQLSLALARLGDREGAERHRRLSRRAQETIEERIRQLRTQPALGSRRNP